MHRSLKKKIKNTLIGGGFEKPFDELSIYEAIIDGKNMELGIGSHNHFASNSESQKRKRERGGGNLVGLRWF